MDYFCFSFLANHSRAFSNTINHLALKFSRADSKIMNQPLCDILRHQVYNIPFNCADHSDIHSFLFRKMYSSDFNDTYYVSPEDYPYKVFPARDKTSLDKDLATLKELKNITIYSNNPSSAKSIRLPYKNLVLFGYSVSMEEYKAKNLKYEAKFRLYDGFDFKDTFDCLTDYVSFMARLNKK